MPSTSIAQTTATERGRSAWPDAPTASRPRAAADPRVALYLKNLAALYRTNPALAAQLDALPFSAAPALEPARDGAATVRLAADDGKLVYVHSRYQPLDEARKLVAALPEVTNPTFFVHGAGLGYALAELERRYERPLLIVAESNLGLIKALLCHSDVRVPLEQHRLLFLTRPDKAHIHDHLFRRSTDVMLGMQTVALPYANRCAVAFHDEMRRQLADFVAYGRLQIVTLVRNSRITCKNIANNLPAYLSQPGLAPLHRRAAGYPAVIVAAGPSLARALSLLPVLRERSVLIAVQTVFKFLLARRVRPHFVTSLDYHEVSREFFRGVDDVGDCTLVAEPKATWHVLDAYPGRKRVLHSPFVDALLRAVAPARAGLKAGSTVAHLAFYLAQHLGCDPIIFVGQDLSYVEGLYYPPGMPIERVWRPELGRFQTIEMKQWERIARSRPILRTVKDVHGRDTYTDEQLFSYAEQFQTEFAASPARVVHAGEAGMRLANTEVLALEAALERYCTRPLPADLFADPEVPPPPALKSQARAALAARIDEVNELKRIATEMSGLLERLVALVERPDEFNRLLVRVDALRVRITQFEQTYQLVVDVSQLAELRRYTADRQLGKQEVETAETARRRLRRDREFVDEFRDGCDFLLEMLPAALERLNEGEP